MESEVGVEGTDQGLGLEEETVGVDDEDRSPVVNLGLDALEVKGPPIRTETDLPLSTEWFSDPEVPEQI